MRLSPRYTYNQYTETRVIYIQICNCSNWHHKHSKCGGVSNKNESGKMLTACCGKIIIPQMLPNYDYGRAIMHTNVKKKQGLPQMSANRPSMDSFKAFCFQDAFDMIPWSSGGEVRVTTHLQSFALPGYYRDKEDALLSHLKLSEATAKWLSHMNLPSAGFALGSCSLAAWSA